MKKHIFITGSLITILIFMNSFVNATNFIDIKQELTKQRGITIGNPNLEGQSLGDDGLVFALACSKKASIWVNKDGVSDTIIPINHGHAALLYSNSEFYKQTIEHRGNVEYSQTYDLDYDTYWKGVKSFRIYNVTEQDNSNVIAYEKMWMAGDYAFSSLINKLYGVAPNKDSETHVNCASLIYQAYKHAGIVFSSGLFPFITPQNLVESPKVIPVAYFQWGGDGNVW